MSKVNGDWYREMSGKLEESKEGYIRAVDPDFMEKIDNTNAYYDRRKELIRERSELFMGLEHAANEIQRIQKLAELWRERKRQRSRAKVKPSVVGLLALGHALAQPVLKDDHDFEAGGYTPPIRREGMDFDENGMMLAGECMPSPVSIEMNPEPEGEHWLTNRYFR